MSKHIDALQKTTKDLEAKAQKIMAERDEAMAKVRDRYDDKLRSANDEAAAAQKAFLTAEVIESLQDRSDGEAVARSLVRQGGLPQDVVDAAYPAADDEG